MSVIAKNIYFYYTGCPFLLFTFSCSIFVIAWKYQSYQNNKLLLFYLATYKANENINVNVNRKHSRKAARWVEKRILKFKPKFGIIRTLKIFNQESCIFYILDYNFSVPLASLKHWFIEEKKSVLLFRSCCLLLIVECNYFKSTWWGITWWTILNCRSKSSDY